MAKRLPFVSQVRAEACKKMVGLKLLFQWKNYKYWFYCLRASEVAVCTPLRMIMVRPHGQKPNAGLRGNGTQRNGH